MQWVLAQYDARDKKFGKFLVAEPTLIERLRARSAWTVMSSGLHMARTRNGDDPARPKRPPQVGTVGGLIAQELRLTIYCAT